jgi:hypothetical protein
MAKNGVLLQPLWIGEIIAGKGGITADTGFTSLSLFWDIGKLLD